MCTKKECIQKLQEAAPFIKKEFGVVSLRLFGSMARGDNNENSDIDVFVDMPPKIFKVIGLKNYLEDLLESSVDVIRDHINLNNFFKQEIERDGILIFS